MDRTHAFSCYLDRKIQGIGASPHSLHGYSLFIFFQNADCLGMKRVWNMEGRVRAGKGECTLCRTKGEGKPGKAAWIRKKPVRGIPGPGTFRIPYLFRLVQDFFNSIMD